MYILCVCVDNSHTQLSPTVWLFASTGSTLLNRLMTLKDGCSLWGFVVTIHKGTCYPEVPIYSQYRDVFECIVKWFSRRWKSYRWTPPFYQHWLTLVPAWISNHIHYKNVRWNNLFIPKLQRCNRWCLGMDKLFHVTLYCDYFSMVG